MRFLGRAFVGLVGVVQCVAITGLIGWQAMAIGVNFDLAACLALCGLGFVAFFVLLFVHELGHQLAALAVGLPFHSFTVGPLQVVREEGRIRVRLNTAWYQPAAYVLIALPTGQGWRWRFGTAVAGGPLANLLVAGPLSEREAGSAKSPRAQSRNAATPGDLHHCPDCRPDAKQITKVTVAQRFLV